MRVSDELAAYCLDRAVATFGSLVEDDIEKETKGKKESQIEAAASVALHRWIGTPMKFANPTPTRR